MKSIFRAIGKFLFYMTYPLILIALVVSLVFNYMQLQEINKINETFKQAQTQLNAENQDKTVTIDDLRQEFTNLNDRIKALDSENARLKQEVALLQDKGQGAVSGKIFPVVANSQQGFSQYQQVCASLASNSKIQYCRTVSALEQNYSLSLPAGEYQVYAQLFPQPNADSSLFGAKAYYSEYVACVQSKDASRCDEKRLTAPRAVTVKVGETTLNVDPIDWR
jgi:cell division protein FtsL